MHVQWRVTYVNVQWDTWVLQEASQHGIRYARASLGVIPDELPLPALPCMIF